MHSVWGVLAFAMGSKHKIQGYMRLKGNSVGVGTFAEYMHNKLTLRMFDKLIF